MPTPNPEYSERLSAWLQKMADCDAQEKMAKAAGDDEMLDVIRYERVMALRHDIDAFVDWQKSPEALPEGFHGRHDEFSVGDVRFLIDCGIDPLR